MATDKSVPDRIMHVKNLAEHGATQGERQAAKKCVGSVA
jgi:hypothetical protein